MNTYIYACMDVLKNNVKPRNLKEYILFYCVTELKGIDAWHVTVEYFYFTQNARAYLSIIFHTVYSPNLYFKQI